MFRSCSDAKYFSFILPLSPSSSSSSVHDSENKLILCWPHQVSLQRVLVPLLRCITAREVLWTSFQMYVNPLFSIVGDILDWISLSSALNALVVENKIKDDMHKDCQVDISSWSYSCCFIFNTNHGMNQLKVVHVQF